MKKSMADIVLGTRIREESGDIAGLADSLAKYGLIHPVVVDEEGRLIAGGRRLEAAKRLGWTEIEVRTFGELSERQRREIELEENVRRKDLTEYERSKKIVELTEVARDVAKEEGEDFRAEVSRNQEIESDKSQEATIGEPPLMETPANPEHEKEFDVDADPAVGDFRSRRERNQEVPFGRPAKVGSYRDVSERTGFPIATLIEAKQHVDAVKEIPALEDQPKKAVIQAGRELAKIADPEQRKGYKEALNEHPNVVQFAQKPQDVMSAVEQRRKDSLQKNFDAIDEAFDTKTRMDKGMGLILRQKTKYNPERIPAVLQNYISCCPQRSDLEMAYENAEAVLQLLIPFRDRLKKLLTKPEVVK